MADQLTLVEVSAFSGLTGALLTQALTGLFGYLGDKRKSNLELKSALRNKQIDIAESFYFVTGEKMAIVKKNIGYWQNWNHSRSEASLEFLNKEMVKLNIYLEKLDLENWKCNLVSLYFDVSLTDDLLIASNDRSKALYLKVLDVTDALKHALPDSKSDLYALYDKAISDMCGHYENVYAQMTSDMQIVKASLLSRLQGK
ncbi:hypothetical protein [Mucilaginibacter sp.]|uniref:hypothetical protein n=1 Tax=Mucilaginibacter sp. TaxID=1882438 RepID=UPI003267C917